MCLPCVGKGWSQLTLHIFPKHNMGLARVWGKPPWWLSATNPLPIIRSKWMLFNVAFPIQFHYGTVDVYVWATFGSGVRSLVLQHLAWDLLFSQSSGLHHWAPKSPHHHPPINPNCKQRIPRSFPKCCCEAVPSHRDLSLTQP